MALTQEALYRELDLDLSWSERDLPERERTKHVHRLHPYLGKFIPQLVEVVIDRYFRPGEHVLDPFAGSGTTLVQALESGLDATGIDIAAFNCLLMQVKTRRYDLFSLEHEIRSIVAGLDAQVAPRARRARSSYLTDWYAPQALGELLSFREQVAGCEHADVLRVVLTRAARSARRTRHFDLEFPRSPQLEPYWCHKHRRTCRPVESASHFLRRYALDTLERIKQFQRLRGRARSAAVLHADARSLELEGAFDGIITSPPYPGLIDYHEQHRYAYELLGLEDLRSLELGPAVRGSGRAALTSYSDGIAAVFQNLRPALRPGAPVVIVVNDRRDLYPGILAAAGLTLEDCHRRHVNRRTGRRAGEYYEDVLVTRFA
ncbi:MAG: DNA methyltransferase [Gaiellaceae bacterium]